MSLFIATRRDVIRVGGVIFASGALGVIPIVSQRVWRKRLEFILQGSGSSSSGTTTGSTSSCLASTNVTRGAYFVDNAAGPNIVGDLVDSSILERSDIRSDDKGSAGTQAGLPLALTITVGSYNSSFACTNISGAQVHIWHCNAQGARSLLGF